MVVIFVVKTCNNNAPEWSGWKEQHMMMYSIDL